MPDIHAQFAQAIARRNESELDNLARVQTAIASAVQAGFGEEALDELVFHSPVRNADVEYEVTGTVVREKSRPKFFTKGTVFSSSALRSHAFATPEEMDLSLLGQNLVARVIRTNPAAEIAAATRIDGSEPLRHVTPGHAVGLFVRHNGKLVAVSGLDDLAAQAPRDGRSR